MSWDDDAAVDTQRVEQKKVAVEEAQLYLVFAQDARAKALLEKWERIAQTPIPPTASHSQFAYAEGQRIFVRGIRQQLEFIKENA